MAMLRYVKRRVRYVPRKGATARERGFYLLVANSLHHRVGVLDSPQARRWADRPQVPQALDERYKVRAYRETRDALMAVDYATRFGKYPVPMSTIRRYGGWIYVAVWLHRVDQQEFADELHACEKLVLDYVPRPLGNAEPEWNPETE